jgi:hypothetical protein
MDNKIIDKIKKLVAHQRSAEEIGSINESIAFAAKIQKLLNEHNIAMSEISFDELKESVIEEVLSAKIPSVSDTLGYFVMRPIAKYNWCRVYVIGKGRTLIVGTPENVEVCKMIYEIVLPIFLKEGKRIFKEENRHIGLDTFLREFIQGCANGLDFKLKTERAEFEAKNVTCTGLIIRNDKAVELYVEEKFGEVRGKKKTVKQSKTWSKGFEVGKNVELNKKLK